MIQTANLNYNSPTHAGLAGLHPSNAANINGRIISRSPTAIHLADQRNLSPNKLNATKKPLFGQNQNANINIGNFARGRTSASPTVKIGNICPNYPNAYQNYNTNTVFGLTNTNRQPLLNSKGHGSKTQYQLPNNSNKINFCQNHHNKPAEFFTLTDGEQTGYCQKCAINLASKGFSVTRMSERVQSRNFQDQKNNIFDSHKLEQFYQPHLIGAPGYNQIEKFINIIDNVHTNYLSQIFKYQNIDQHYDNQYEITENFYEELLDLVEQMKNDHLNDLKNEAKKHSQHALIKEDHLKSDLQQMEVIRKDLVESIDAILSDFNAPVVQEPLGLYKQQILKFKDTIEEENLQFGKLIINQKESQLKARLKKIQDYLLDVWNDKNQNRQQQQQQQQQFNKPPVNPQPIAYRTNDQRVPNPPQDRSPKSVKHLLNLNPRPAEAETKKVTAYRKLFEDENENLQQQAQDRPKNDDFNEDQLDFNSHEELGGQKSPQFKNI